MSYQKQNFANGEVLTASQLNHIENGIADVESTANATKGVVDKIIDPTLSLSGKAADAAKVGGVVRKNKKNYSDFCVCALTNVGVGNVISEEIDYFVTGENHKYRLAPREKKFIYVGNTKIKINGVLNYLASYSLIKLVDTENGYRVIYDSGWIDSGNKYEADVLDCDFILVPFQSYSKIEEDKIPQSLELFSVTNDDGVDIFSLAYDSTCAEYVSYKDSQTANEKLKLSERRIEFEKKELINGKYDAERNYIGDNRRISNRTPLKLKKGDVIRYHSLKQKIALSGYKKYSITPSVDYGWNHHLEHVLDDDYEFLISFAYDDDTPISPDDYENDFYCVPRMVETIDKLETSFAVADELCQQVKFVHKEPVYTNCLTLLHCSDLHGEVENAKRINDFFNKHSMYINDIVHTGDAVLTFLEDDNPLSGFLKIMNVIGNHDCWRKGESWYNATAKEAYNKFLLPYVANWNVVQPDEAEENGYCYYYKDYSAWKTRLIALDCMHYDEVQNQWFASILADAKSMEYSVVVASHYYPQNGLDKIGCSFTSIEFDLVEASGDRMECIVSQAVETINNFQTSGGKFICWLCGHAHFDFIGTVKNYPNQLCIVIESSGLKTNDESRRSGTKTQDAFNVIGFDTINSMVKFARIGVNYDAYMRSKKTFCYDYKNHKLISNT